VGGRTFEGGVLAGHYGIMHACTSYTHNMYTHTHNAYVHTMCTYTLVLIHTHMHTHIHTHTHTQLFLHLDYQIVRTSYNLSLMDHADTSNLSSDHTHMQ